MPLRLLGGLHFLVLAGRASWDSVPDALTGEAAFLARFVAEQGVQTNEVQRSWVLAPCLARVAERIGADTVDLVELGPSAGLNLVWDRYRCEYAGGSTGPAGAAVVLTGEERRRVPPSTLGRAPVVRRRLGIDRAPIDVTTDEGARLLQCFVWADQHERLARLRAAIAELRRDPPELVQGDFVERLPAILAERADDLPTIVFQTAVLAYVADEGRTRLRAALDEAGASGAPLAFVSTGRPREDGESWGLRLTYWPGHEREFVGHADYHGAWLDWELA